MLSIKLHQLKRLSRILDKEFNEEADYLFARVENEAYLLGMTENQFLSCINIK